MTILLPDKPELAIDVETYSETDIKNGSYAYADSPFFEIILVAYKYGEGPTRSFMPRAFAERPGVLTDSEAFDFTQIPPDFEMTGSEDEFLSLLTDHEIIKTAYNANFERTTLAKQYSVECDPDEWRCTMILASTLGLPRSLKDVGDAMGLPEDEKKLTVGRRLIQYFCKPCKPTKKNGGRTRNMPWQAPDDWKLFVEYNLQDVDAEHGIRKRLIRYAPNKKEQALWSVDQHISDRGIRVNREMAEGIVEFEAERQDDLMEEARQITGLDNPNSVAQLKQWFKSKGCYSLGDDCSKAAIAKALSGKLPDDIRRVCEIRQSLGKTSVKKYDAVLHSVCHDDRVRGMLQFYGANRTGRWAGRIVQLQNLPQNHITDLALAHDLVCDRDFDTLEMLFGDPEQVFSELVRTCFIPSDDCRFVVTDFSAIEARVIAWMAGEQWRLDVFRKGGDIYCESASQMFHMPVVKHGINGDKRQQGKIAELALGYGGGVGAIASMDKGNAIPEDERQGIVDKWREASPHITRLWKKLEYAAKEAILTHTPQTVRGKVTYYYRDGILFCRLPSGRPIAYWGAHLEEGDYGPEIRYQGVGDSKAWMTLKTYGGKLTENVIQATARDCLAEKMMKAEAMGYKIVAHVHDEMIIDVPNSDKDAFQKIDDLMAEPIDWAPGLPLKGGTYECPYYQKD